MARRSRSAPGAVTPIGPDDGPDAAPAPVAHDVPDDGVAAVVVTYSVPSEDLARCLRSLQRGGGVETTILIDNGGRAEVPADVDVDLIRSDSNRGFGAAANLGFERAIATGARWIALLNDDVEVEPGWLEPLLDALAADPRCGAAQPKVLLLGPQPQRVNSLGVQIGPDGAGRDIGYDTLDGPENTTGRTIDVFTGAAVVFRREYLEDTGGFDERYFLYYEDVDLALRGGERGWTYRCEPASRVHHVHGSSTDRIHDLRAALQERNRTWVAVRFARPRVIAASLWLSVRRLRFPPRRAHARGLIGALAGSPRRVVERVRAGR